MDGFDQIAQFLSENAGILLMSGASAAASVSLLKDGLEKRANIREGKKYLQGYVDAHTHYEEVGPNIQRVEDVDDRLKGKNFGDNLLEIFCNSVYDSDLPPYEKGVKHARIERSLDMEFPLALRRYGFGRRY